MPEKRDVPQEIKTPLQGKKADSTPPKDRKPKTFAVSPQGDRQNSGIAPQGKKDDTISSQSSGPKSYSDQTPGQAGAEGKSPRGKKQALRRLTRYFLQYKGMVIAAFILTVAGNLLALLGPWLSGEAIDAIGLQTGVDFPAVFLCCALMAAFYALSSALSYALSVLMIHLSQRIVRAMRQDVFDKILSLPIGSLDRMQAGDLINRISYDIDTVNASLSNDILQAAAGIISIAGAFVGMLLISPALLGVFLLTVPLSVLVAYKRSKKMRPLFRRRAAELAKLNGFSEEMLSGLKTIKAYGVEAPIEGKFADANRAAADAYYEADCYGSMLGPAVSLIGNLGTSLIGAAGTLMFVFGRMSLGNINAFLQYARKFSGPINECANIVGEIQSALAAAERVFRLLDAPSEPADLPDAAVPEKVRGDVEFSHVRFGYSEDVTVISDLSFSAKAGQTVALVGPTGAGKTTLVNLLMRFYDPQGGCIRLDGKDIRTYTRAGLRACFSMVLQDTWLFDGTIFENIAYGREGADEEDVRRAAREANIASFIESLPLGYQTPVTDGGVNFSKGQKQLMTIARAMLSDAPMLIMDEATSNVDTRTELLIHDAMAKLMRGRTCFVIAHRLSTIVGADLILVVRNGDIVEFGRHEELLQKKGFYAGMYGAQFE